MKKSDTNWPEKRINGFKLHQQLDSFIDKQPTFIEAVTMLPKPYRRFGGVINDVFIDYFLARHWQQYHKHHANSTESFAQEVYKQFEKLSLPKNERLERSLYYMQEQNWLGNYQHQWAIERVFKGLDYRCRFDTPLLSATDCFDQLEEHWQKHFEELFHRLWIEQSRIKKSTQ